jgi:hypothetical protein
MFVSDDDPAVITGVIDWQSSSIEPAFWYAERGARLQELLTIPCSRINLIPTLSDA